MEPDIVWEDDGSVINTKGWSEQSVGRHKWG